MGKFFLILFLIGFNSFGFPKIKVTANDDLSVQRESIQQAIVYFRNAMFEDSLHALNKVNLKDLERKATTNAESLLLSVQTKFYTLANNYHLLDKATAETQAEKLIEYLEWQAGGGSAQHLREIGMFRYWVITMSIADDLKTWKNRDLGEVGRLMKQSHGYLDPSRIERDAGDKGKESKEGKAVDQKVKNQKANLAKADKAQKKAIEILDELIKQKEDQANGGGKGDGSSDPSKGEKGGDAKAKGPQPLEDSKIAELTGKGVVDEKKLRVLAEAWGTMNEKQRAKAIMDITRDYPARYRVIIEDYFKALANTPKK